ncbi:MAG: hypothetical protein RLZZ283_349, partial [Candidatus Parcubacteria bacterium]
LGPIFALYIVGSIEGGSAEVAGIAIAIYLGTKSLLQLPAAHLVDTIRGDHDDFWFMFWSLLVASLVPLSYLFITTPYELYAAQFVLGLALAFNYPSFMALFTKYIPVTKEATTWSIYYTLFDLLSAGSAAIGGVLAIMFGFEPVIVATSAIGVVGALLLLPIRGQLRKTGA